MLILRRVLVLWFVPWFFASSTAAQLFKAELTASEWKAVTAAAPVCSIAHNIPGFGRAVFVHTPSKGETFYVESQSKIIFPVGEVDIETLPPVWRSDLMSVSLGKVMAVVGTQPIKMEAAQTAPLLAQLIHGVSIVFTSLPVIAKNKSSLTQEGAGVKRAMRLVLEVKNFAPAYKIYQQCTGELVASAVEKIEGLRSAKTVELSRMKGYIKRDAALYSDSIVDHSGPRVGEKILTADEELAKVMGLIKRDTALYGATVAGKKNSRAKEQIFAADIMSADWKPVSNPFACSITHSIPGFGKASLSHKAGGEEIFYIESQGKIIFPAGDTSIDTLPPVWRNNLLPINLGSVNAVAGKQPITLASSKIAQVVSQLSNGVKVMFSSSDLIEKKINNASVVDLGVMRVVLESKNFAGAYKNYQQCIGELINYTFAQVARTLINYSEKPQGLTAATKVELSKVARYVRADQKVIRILVDAHSDNAEAVNINEAISKQYADWVSAYLVGQGVPADKITSRWHGEKFPIATNKTAQGRAQNRRVTVRLETEETQQENEKNAAARKAALEAEKLNPDKGKLTPEDINKMVEGLDLIPQ